MGLRLMQSMSPTALERLGWRTITLRHGGLFDERFEDAFHVYAMLPPAPRRGAGWGPQPVAGHATTSTGRDVFVGENSDLLWRALTETDYYGRSPLKAAMFWEMPTVLRQEMIVAAALYDNTAEKPVNDRPVRRYRSRRPCDAC